MYEIWFRTIRFMKNIPDFLFSDYRHFDIVESEQSWLPETDNNDSFSMLGNPVLSVNYLEVDMISQILLQCTGNNIKCMTLVMRF